MKHLFAVFLLFFVPFSHSLYAQTSNSSLTITNEENKTITLSINDIKAMPHVTLDVKAHDEKMHSYTGVFLYNLLQKAGVVMGDSAKKKVSGSYVVITAADNYKAVYALSDIDTLQSDKKVLLADGSDGKPLPDNALPYQIIATGEKIHARMIRQVTSIAVHKAL